jgi:hypothetical protein
MRYPAFGHAQVGHRHPLFRIIVRLHFLDHRHLAVQHGEMRADDVEEALAILRHVARHRHLGAPLVAIQPHQRPRADPLQHHARTPAPLRVRLAQLVRAHNQPRQQPRRQRLGIAKAQPLHPRLAELRKGRRLRLRQQFRDQPTLRFLRLARRRLGLLQRKGHLELLHQLHDKAVFVRRIILRRQRLRDPRPLPSGAGVQRRDWSPTAFRSAVNIMVVLRGKVLR